MFAVWFGKYDFQETLDDASWSECSKFLRQSFHKFLREYEGRNELVKLKVAVNQMVQLYINKLYTFFSSCFTYYTLVKKSKETSNIKCGVQ